MYFDAFKEAKRQAGEFETRMRAKKEDYSHIETSTTQDAATTTDTATNNATPEDDFEQFSNQEDEEKVRTYLHVSLFIVFRRLKKPGLKRWRREMQQKRFVAFYYALVCSSFTTIAITDDPPFQLVLKGYQGSEA